jgi:hypothetical protein
MISHASKRSFLLKSLRHRSDHGITRSSASSTSFFVSTRTTSSPRLLWQRNSSSSRSSSSTHQRAVRLLSSDEGGASAAATSTASSSLNTSATGLLSKIVAWYSNKLETHPLITKGISSVSHVMVNVSVVDPFFLNSRSSPTFSSFSLYIGNYSSNR